MNVKLRTALVFAVLSMFALADRTSAETTNDTSLQTLVSLYLPTCHLRLDDAKKPEAVVSATGEVLDLATQQSAQPSNHVVGYYFSPTMDFLSHQKIKASTSEQAVGVIQLLHALNGRSDIKKKTYSARPIDVGWLVEVNHDFHKYPANVFVIPPYELLLDSNHDVIQIKQRCYVYAGTAKVYTNTLISAYERELKNDSAQHFPGDLIRFEFPKAWRSEKDQLPTLPGEFKNEQ